MISNGVWKESSARNSVYKLYKLFDETGCICNGKIRWKHIPENQGQALRAAVIPSPNKSV